ncbi:hypothetical protein HPB48_015412 [Haemaphysalis longicornis]|uniref:Reverse transcriptase domain-containing protein n=1 Tax=Haemaphysalis longicornis TaxID=44386 RepID=A0A9J6FZX7_HAELO|nr:hypothetical protein HPB48_015412 [Haemaphysalis longicornis]
MEHIVLKHILTFVEANNVINKNQPGFQKGRSTTTQLLETFHDLARTVDKLLTMTARLLLRLLHLDDALDRPDTTRGEINIDGDEIVPEQFHAQLVALLVCSQWLFRLWRQSQRG